VQSTTKNQSNHDCRGIPVSNADTDAIVGLEVAHESFLAFRGDPLDEINKVIEQNPDFILAYLFKAAYLTQVLEARVFDDLENSVSAAEKLSANANTRELIHLKAVSAWVKGEISEAVSEWERALTQFPRDLLAIQLIHLTHVLFGDVAGQRDIVARVFNLWDEETDGYEFVLGFYAFGLEENRDFERAEQMARHSLLIREDNPYAIHAVCHVMDMQGRQAEGLQFMYDNEKTWASSGFEVHLWWHTALLHLDMLEFDKALQIFDDKLRARKEDSNRYEEFDATALLWRLKLADIDVGERWSELADKWEPSAEDTVYAFNSVHAMMAFVSDARDDMAKLLLAKSQNLIKDPSNANFSPVRDVGLPFCLAISDFEDKRYSECVDRLMQIRSRIDLLGGSFVQRDIIGWTMVEAAIRAHRYDLALSLANQRYELKPTSPQNWLHAARAQEGLGASKLAKHAKTKIELLLSR
jgi:tetratricopeptide (TPR) repeat protein